MCADFVCGKQSVRLSAEHEKIGQKPEPTFIKGKRKRNEKTENRKRNVTLSIRLTAEEKEALTKKAKEADLSMTDYILRCSSRKKIKVVNMTKVIVELKRIGNNLNQITRRINSGEFRSYNFNEVVLEQRRIYDLILSMMGND